MRWVRWVRRAGRLVVWHERVSAVHTALGEPCGLLVSVGRAPSAGRIKAGLVERHKLVFLPEIICSSEAPFHLTGTKNLSAFLSILKVSRALVNECEREVGLLMFCGRMVAPMPLD